MKNESEGLVGNEANGMQHTENTYREGGGGKHKEVWNTYPGL